MTASMVLAGVGVWFLVAVVVAPLVGKFIRVGKGPSE